MKASVSMIRTIRTAAMLAALTATLALTACQTDGTGPSATDAPKAQTASEPAPKPETAPTQTVRPATAADDGEPMTHARAARECWMRTEKANPHQDLDKRADVVNKCIEDKLKAAGIATPKT
jgi:predicted cobalt transporter CbtA